MTQNRAFVPTLLLLAAIVSWGCTRPPAAAVTPADATKPLETRVAKLELELKTLTASRDQVQARLIATEAALRTAEESARTAEESLAATKESLRTEQARAKLIEQEREEALSTMKTRTAERDALQTQFESFRRNIRELVGQADTAAKPVTPSNVSVRNSPKGL